MKEIQRGYQGSFKGVLRKFQGFYIVFQVDLKGVQRVFVGVSNVLLEFFSCVSRKIKGCSEKRLKVIQGSFKGI